MSGAREQTPAVMSLAGLDPTGGAGLQADIESILSMGGHPLPVITTVTVQDTRDVHAIVPVEAVDVISQARAVLGDIPVAAFKIGLLGSVENIEAVHTLLLDFPDTPVVLDPVLAAGGGTALADDEQLDAMVSLLLPQVTLLTPNGNEARALAPEADSLKASAQQIMSYGCGYVLVTGTHERTEDVVNHFYANHRLVESFTWPRLERSYHGSGCTLSAAAATLLGHGLEPLSAVSEAQEYTWESLNRGYALGTGQWFPDRLHWAREDD